MPVDHAEVLRRLKAVIAAKPSHGQRDLLAEIGRLEAELGVEDTPYQRFLRRFGDELMEAFLNVAPADGVREPPGAARPLTGAAASAPAMDTDAPPSTGAESATEEPCRTPVPPPPRTRPRSSGTVPSSAAPSPTASLAPALTP